MYVYVYSSYNDPHVTTVYWSLYGVGQPGVHSYI